MTRYPYLSLHMHFCKFNFNFSLSLLIMLDCIYKLLFSFVVFFVKESSSIKNLIGENITRFIFQYYFIFPCDRVFHFSTTIFKTIWNYNKKIEPKKHFVKEYLKYILISYVNCCWPKNFSSKFKHFLKN